jgi:hypothetical protein
MWGEEVKERTLGGPLYQVAVLYVGSRRLPGTTQRSEFAPGYRTFRVTSFGQLIEQHMSGAVPGSRLLPTCKAAAL